MSIIIAIVAIAACWWWMTQRGETRRSSQFKRVKGFTKLCQQAPGEQKAEALALLELRKSPWRGKAYAVEQALYHLEKDRK